MDNKTPIHISNPTSLIAAVPAFVNIPFENLPGSVVMLLFTSEGEGWLSLGAMRVNVPDDYDLIEDWWREVMQIATDIDGLDQMKVIVYVKGECDDLIGAGVLGCASAINDMAGRPFEIEATGIVGSDGFKLEPFEEPRSLDLITLFDPDLPAPEATVTEWPEPTEQENLEFGRHLIDDVANQFAYFAGSIDPTDAVLAAIEEQSLAAAARMSGLVSTDRGLQDFVLTAGWGAELGHYLWDQVVKSGRDDVDEEIDAPILHAIGGFDFPRPNTERVAQAINLMEKAVCRIPSTGRQGTLTALAFLHFFLGHSSEAHVLTMNALDLDGDMKHGAHMLHHAIDAGHVPEWGKREVPKTEVGLAWVSRVN